MSFLWSFGANHSGQLGTELDANSMDSTPTPAIVKLPQNFIAKKVAIGKTFAASVTDRALLFCGAKDGSQQTSSFEKAVLPSDENGTILDLAVGDSCAAVVTSSGDLYCYGQLENHQEEIATKAQLIDFPFSQRIIQVSIGSNHILALSSCGSCFAWGANNKGQLGNGPGKSFFQRPLEITSVRGIPVKQVTAGGNHSFILSVSGALFSFGDNAFGQLGLGDEIDRDYPNQVKTLRSQFVTYMAAGFNHSAALTADGGVFTFGSGKYGQLGHNSVFNENIPKKIIELMGSNVIQISCGRSHTLALVQSDIPKLYAFGHGTFGQLGASKDNFTNAQAPILSKNVMDTIGQQQKIVKVFAGGDSCFILTTNQPISPADMTKEDSLPRIYHIDVPKLKEVLVNEKINLEPIVLSIFSNASCLNASFLLPNRQHFNCSSRNSGVDLSASRQGWHALLTSDRTMNCEKTVADVVFHTLTNYLFPKLPSSPPDVEALRLYLILPTSARFDNPSHYKELQCPFASSVCALEKPAERVLLKWWANLEVDDFRRLVSDFKKIFLHLIDIMEESKSLKLLNPIAANQAGLQFEPESRLNMKRLHNCLEILRKFHKSNEELRANHNSLDCRDFYIAGIHELCAIDEAYVAWWHTKQTSQHESLFNLCNYPFIFDAQAKSVLLQTDARLQMHYAMNSERRVIVLNLFQHLVQPANPFLSLTVHRNNIVHGTISQLAMVQKSDLKKPLKITFADEAGDDAGALKKEFFLLLFKELFDPKYGMFTSDEVSRLFWFNDILEDPESIAMYQFIGLLCGLAIYNSIIVDMSFPLAMFKKLLNMPCNLEDLKELSPTVGKNLEHLLEYDDGENFQDIFDLNFVLTRDHLGLTENIELVPNGRDKVVTMENRQEYVDRYVDFIFNKSVAKQFDSFMKGFQLVCNGEILSMFHPVELRALVIGNENYDWHVLQANAEYKGEYYAKHPVIVMFWEVFHDLSLGDKKKFLLFLTGSDRIPILGMESVKIIIQPMKVDEKFLPVAHSCFNLLDLPPYTDRKVLKEKLLAAIEHNQGFGIA